MNRKSTTIALTLITALILGAGCQDSFVSETTRTKELKGKITISPSKKIGEINPDVYGLFTEMCFFEFNQGMWAEMLKSRKFAEDDGDPGEKGYGVVKPWFPIGKNEKTHFAHDNTIYYCGKQSQKIISESDNNSRTGIGQKGLYFEKGKKYHVRLNLKQKGITSSITIALQGDDGTTYAAKEISVTAGDWIRVAFDLEPTKTEKNGTLAVTLAGSGILWLGTISMMPEDNVSGFRKEIVEALKAMGPPNIRWPGGNMVSVYHWQEGTGDRDKRPSRLIRELWDPFDVGIDEFLALCKAVGTKPYIALNAGDGTPEEAANWVEYCNGSQDTKYGKLRAQNGHPEPYSIKLWGIGNEMFGNWQNGHVDEETYARRHVAIAKAILAVDKDIKIVASGGRYWKYPRWNQALLKIAGDYLDYISLHSYAKKYRSKMQKEDLKNLGFAAEFYHYIVSSPYGIEEQIIETDKEIRETLPNRPDIKIAFDEWNCWAYRPPGGDLASENVDFALRDALYTAGVFHAFRRQHKAVTLANFSKTVNAMPLIKINQSGIFLNPQYLAFKMYLNHSGPTLVQTHVTCDSYPAPDYERNRPQAKGDIPYLDASATLSEDGKTLYLAVVNLHTDKNINAAISLNDWAPSPAAKIFEIYDEDYMAENTFENPNQLTIQESTLSNVSNSFNYNFKPHSATTMKFREK